MNTAQLIDSLLSSLFITFHHFSSLFMTFHRFITFHHFPILSMMNFPFELIVFWSSRNLSALSRLAKLAPARAFGFPAAQECSDEPAPGGTNRKGSTRNVSWICHPGTPKETTLIQYIYIYIILYISPIEFQVRRCDPWSVCYKKDSQAWGYRMRLLSSIFPQHSLSYKMPRRFNNLDIGGGFPLLQNAPSFSTTVSYKDIPFDKPA